MASLCTRNFDPEFPTIVSGCLKEKSGTLRGGRVGLKLTPTFHAFLAFLKKKDFALCQLPLYSKTVFMRRNGAPLPQQRFYSMDPTNQRPCSFYRTPKFLCWSIGPLFVLGLFAWGCFAFSYLICIDSPSTPSGTGALYIIIFNGAMVMATLSLLKTTFTDPGSVPRGFEEVRF